MAHIENRSCYGVMLWDARASADLSDLFLTFEEKWKNACRIEEIFVPLQCQMREVKTPPIKDKKCEG